MSIDNSVKVLVNDIKASKEYKIFKQAMKNLDKHEDVKKEIETLQQKQIQLYKTKRSKQEIESELKNLSNEYKRLSSKPEVMNMLKAGEDFNKLMGTIYLNISKLLDSDF